MDPDQLYQMLIVELVPSLENCLGLQFFARNRSKFEGWLKVELCSVLGDFQPTPEQDRFDIGFANWLLELKTPNNSYRGGGLNDTTRPITQNIDGILGDIQKLRGRPEVLHRGIIFVAFPFTEENIENEIWRNHVDRIGAQINLFPPIRFRFSSTDLFGKIYFGTV